MYLKCSYWQISIDKHDLEKSTFLTLNVPHKFPAMPKGDFTTPAVLHLTMGTVLEGLKSHINLVYLDDVVVFSATFKEHHQ